MTTITQTISALDPVPSRDDPDNFDTEADQFLGKLPTMRTELNTLGGQINTVAGEVNANAAAAATSAGAANTAKLDAQAARDIAQAAANFKGTWASLSGALNKPASVQHSGAFWVLLNNLANVATSEPGVSGDWARLGGLSVMDEGSTVATAASMNFVGDAVQVAAAGNDVTVTVTAPTLAELHTAIY